MRVVLDSTYPRVLETVWTVVEVFIKPVELILPCASILGLGAVARRIGRVHRARCEQLHNANAPFRVDQV